MKCADTVFFVIKNLMKHGKCSVVPSPFLSTPPEIADILPGLASSVALIAQAFRSGIGHVIIIAIKWLLLTTLQYERCNVWITGYPGHRVALLDA